MTQTSAELSEPSRNDSSAAPCEECFVSGGSFTVHADGSTSTEPGATIVMCDRCSAIAYRQTWSGWRNC